MLIGYSTSLRSITAGEGNFSAEFIGYKYIGDENQNKLLENPYDIWIINLLN